ncbi:cupin domain-containing protein [Conexibacter woesei]|uniref:Cupin 2 conserved barrel domain protein n=1 Tax=Conexibacter woesei (strain DSM 14684 / CCUG 47730 / CIP 108061 / JCM 11494 / NBRC 100937 / ID131577) TaxID=469383 RepID=D3F551_CONWI|nr:cupin domain-containing protein [Conexibacter woesei]ADB48629.1 Cupin 2 conserved barrel domain protein [Conexibacter woesei DSM 14684]
MHLARHAELEPYVTRDGSTIREWAGPGYSPARNQSLAEATLPPGRATTAHYHRAAEELYLFTAGRGRLRVGDAERDVQSGDCVVIPPGAVHKLWNTGDDDLVLVCACSPAYSHEDTFLAEGEPDAG